MLDEVGFEHDDNAAWHAAAAGGRARHAPEGSEVRCGADGTFLVRFDSDDEDDGDAASAAQADAENEAARGNNGGPSLASGGKPAGASAAAAAARGAREERISAARVVAIEVGYGTCGSPLFSAKVIVTRRRRDRGLVIAYADRASLINWSRRHPPSSRSR